MVVVVVVVVVAWMPEGLKLPDLPPPPPTRVRVTMEFPRPKEATSSVTQALASVTLGAALLWAVELHCHTNTHSCDNGARRHPPPPPPPQQVIAMGNSNK